MSSDACVQLTLTLRNTQSTETAEDLQVDIAEALEKQPGLGEEERERRSTVDAANRAGSMKTPSCQMEKARLQMRCPLPRAVLETDCKYVCKRYR